MHVAFLFESGHIQSTAKVPKPRLDRLTYRIERLPRETIGTHSADSMTAAEPVAFQSCTHEDRCSSKDQCFRLRDIVTDHDLVHALVARIGQDPKRTQVRRLVAAM